MKELPVTPGRRVMCPEDCRYRNKLAPFCGYCLSEVMKKIEREKRRKEMATEKKTGLDKAKIRTLEKLKEAGFDTAAKVRTLEARQMLKPELANEMGSIFDLQDAIKAYHS